MFSLRLSSVAIGSPPALVILRSVSAVSRSDPNLRNETRFENLRSRSRFYRVRVSSDGAGGSGTTIRKGPPYFAFLVESREDRFTVMHALSQILQRHATFSMTTKARPIGVRFVAIWTNVRSATVVRLVRLQRAIKSKLFITAPANMYFVVAATRLHYAVDFYNRILLGHYSSEILVVLVSSYLKF